MILRQGYVDESLMHSKGIVDLALFSSGIHFFTLKLLLLSSENDAGIKESKGGNITSPQAWILCNISNNDLQII